VVAFSRLTTVPWYVVCVCVCVCGEREILWEDRGVIALLPFMSHPCCVLQSVYKTMLTCWEGDWNKRPKTRLMQMRLEAILGEEEERLARGATIPRPMEQSRDKTTPYDPATHETGTETVDPLLLELGFDSRRTTATTADSAVSKAAASVATTCSSTAALFAAGGDSTGDSSTGFRPRTVTISNNYELHRSATMRLLDDIGNNDIGANGGDGDASTQTPNNDSIDPQHPPRRSATQRIASTSSRRSAEDSYIITNFARTSAASGGGGKKENRKSRDEDCEFVPENDGAARLARSASRSSQYLAVSGLHPATKED
jgi:hypothetical protein